MKYNGILWQQFGIKSHEMIYVTNGKMKWNVRYDRDDHSRTRGYCCDVWNSDGVILYLISGKRPVTGIPEVVAPPMTLCIMGVM